MKKFLAVLSVILLFSPLTVMAVGNPLNFITNPYTGDPASISNVVDAFGSGDASQAISILCSFLFGVPQDYFMGSGLLAGVTGAALNVTGFGLAVLAIGFIQYTVLPFVGIWMIVYGFMKELRIFRRARRLNTWLPLLVAITCLTSHLSFWLVRFLFSIIGIWSILMFGFIFIVGLWKYGALRRAMWGGAIASAEAEAEVKISVRKELRELHEERANLVAEMADARGSRLTELSNRIDKIDTRIGTVREQLKKIDAVTGAGG